MRISRCIRIIAFIAALVALLSLSSTILKPKWYGIDNITRTVDGFYELEENSIEVLLLGPSVMIRGVSAMEMYNSYGISAYTIGTQSQPMLCSYYWLKESLRYQNPKVVVLDVTRLFKPTFETAYRKALDYMKWSRIKLEAVTAHCKDNEEASAFSYMFPISLYHSRWAELNEADFKYLFSDKYNPLRGFSIVSEISGIEHPGIETVESEPAEFRAEGYEYFLKIIELCESEGIELLLIEMPQTTVWDSQKSYTTGLLAKQYDLPFIDFNTTQMMDEINLNFSEDSGDKNHLNIYGAEKISEYLGSYLKENYDLKDVREDLDYSYMQDDLDFYLAEKQEAKSN